MTGELTNDRLTHVRLTDEGRRVFEGLLAAEKEKAKAAGGLLAWRQLRVGIRDRQHGLFRVGRGVVRSLSIMHR
jgi:hypothetical protein